MHLLHFPSYNPSWWIHITSHERIYLFIFIYFHYNRILAKMQDDTERKLYDFKKYLFPWIMLRNCNKLILTKVNYKFSVEALRLCPMGDVNFGWYCDSWVMYLNILKPHSFKKYEILLWMLLLWGELSPHSNNILGLNPPTSWWSSLGILASSHNLQTCSLG